MTEFIILSSHLYHRKHSEKFHLRLTIGVIPTSRRLWLSLHTGQAIKLKAHHRGTITPSLFGHSLLLSIVYPTDIQVNILQRCF